MWSHNLHLHVDKKIKQSIQVQKSYLQDDPPCGTTENNNIHSLQKSFLKHLKHNSDNKMSNELPSSSLQGLCLNLLSMEPSSVLSTQLVLSDFNMN